MLNLGGGQIINITSSLVDKANSNVPSVLASLTKGARSPPRSLGGLVVPYFVTQRQGDPER